MCFPLFASLKKSFPQIQITVLSPNKNSSLILGKNTYIDNLFEFGLNKFTYMEILKFFLKRFLNLRRFFKINSFDLFIIVHPNPLRTLLSLILPYKSAIINTENTHKSLEVKNILDALKIKTIFNYNIKADIHPDLISKFNLNSKKYVLFDVYPQHLERDPRRWYYFDELIKKFTGNGFTVVLAGINKDHRHVPGVVDLINKTTLDELLTVIGNARLVISLDSGIFHFSYSLGTPVVGIFGPVNPSFRIPMDKKLKVVAIYNNLDCSPCIENKVDIECKNHSHPYECMKKIDADMVWEKAKKFIEKK